MCYKIIISHFSKQKLSFFWKKKNHMVFLIQKKKNPDWPFINKPTRFLGVLGQVDSL